MKTLSSQLYERAEELRSFLNKANHAYYVLDSPLMEDVVYDKLYRELIDLEKQNPDLITPDSPTQRLGGKPAQGFKSIKHRVPLLSLDNAFNLEELMAWYQRTKKVIEEKDSNQLIKPLLPMVGELKIDGNALALSYSNGMLVRAATRGDGKAGEEITSNVKTITSIPLSLQINNPPEWVEVRGEAFIPNNTFDEINLKREKNGENVFANPRNACSGTLRQLDPQVVASRRLDFFAYTLHLPEEWNPQNDDLLKPQGQWQALQWLKKAGFKVNPNAQLLKTMQEVQNFFNFWEVNRYTLPYETDGAVIKIDNFEAQIYAGFTQKAPRWAIALKYPAVEAPSKLIKLTYQVGRTGVVTPVAIFKPVTLAGTSVSRATLHNANRIADLDLHSDDTIVIRKAGEIIPEVVRVVKELRPFEAKPLNLPTNCPECESKLIREIDASATCCINSSCPAILRGALRHWVSKGALDVDGLGSKLIEQLVNRGLVTSIATLYELDTALLASLERMGVKSAENLVAALIESKKQPWHKQLYGLGIHHIGEANAKILATSFPSISQLSLTAKDSPEVIQIIHGIGKEIIESLNQWFSNPCNQELINSLKRVGFSLEASEADVAIQNKSDKQLQSSVNGKTFVLTGTMESLSRTQAKSIIEKNGGKVNSSVSSNTTYLVAGTKSGSKLTKAQTLGIEIINEQQLKNMLSIE